MDSSTLIFWTSPFSGEGVCGNFFIIATFCINHVLNENCVDLEQTPRSASSDQGLHCLSMSFL